MQKCGFNKVAKQKKRKKEIALRHGCSPVNLLHTFRITFRKNISEGLLLYQTSIIEYFCENKEQFKAITNFRKKSPSKMFDRLLCELYQMLK